MNLQPYNPQVTEQNEVAIKLLNHYQELTMPLLSRLTGYGASTSKRILERLVLLGYCHQVKHKNRLYYRTGKDKTPKVTRVREYKPFGGVPWNPENNRPGCQDFLQYPSRIGDKLVPHRPMMHGCTPTGYKK